VWGQGLAFFPSFTCTAIWRSNRWITCLRLAHRNGREIVVLQRTRASEREREREREREKQRNNRDFRERNLRTSSSSIGVDVNCEDEESW